MTFPTIPAGQHANEPIGGYDNFIEYLNAVAAAAGSVGDLETEIATKAPSSALDVVSSAVATLSGNLDWVGARALKDFNNLSDLVSAPTARANLGLGSAASLAASDVLRLNPAAGAPQMLTAGAAGDKGLVIRLAAAATAPGLEVQSFAGNPIASITASGKGLFTNVGPTAGNLNLVDSSNDIGVQIRTTDVTIPKRIIVSASGTAALTMNGQLIAAASSAARSSLQIPHGTAPTTPVDGDMWTNTAGAFIRINGVTKQFAFV